MPRFSACWRSMSCCSGTPLTLETQSTLLGTAAMIFIQASKAARLNFSGIVKGTEDEGIFRQAAFCAARRRFGDRGRRGDVIALRQAGDRFAVEFLLALGNHDVVGDKVVDEGKPQAAGMAQPIDLDRAGAEHHDRRARRFHIAVEIDQDVDAQIADAPGHVDMRQVTELVIEVDAVPMALVVVRITAAPALRGDGMHLEPVAVMQREQLQRHMADRMVGEIGRHIGDADAPRRVGGIGRRQGRQQPVLGQ